MFIRVSHKMKNVVTKHWKINLWLAFIAFFVLLTILSDSTPNVAKIILLIVLGFSSLFAFMGSLCAMCDFDSLGSVCIFLAIMGFILAVVIAIVISIFNGLAWLK